MSFKVGDTVWLRPSVTLKMLEQIAISSSSARDHLIGKPLEIVHIAIASSLKPEDERTVTVKGNWWVYESYLSYDPPKPPLVEDTRAYLEIVAG